VSLSVTVRLGLDGSTWQTPRDEVTFTDVTQYVSFRDGISINRGRATERDEVRAGTCSLTLIDPDRRFDPENASGPYYGNLNPGVPIQIRASVSDVSTADTLTWDGETLTWDGVELIWGAGAAGGSVDRFYGFVEDFPQGSPDPADKRVFIPVDATDAFGMLALGRMSSAYSAAILADSPRAYWPLDETAGTVAYDLSGNNRNATYTTGTTANAGSIETDNAVTPGLVLDGEYQAHLNMRLAGYDLSNAVGCLIDLTTADDLTNGEQLVLVEYGHGFAQNVIGSGGFFGAPFQWGVEIISTTARTARLFIRGPIAWPNFTYSGSFSYATPRYVASRTSMATTPGTNHYVDGVITNGSTSTALVTGQQWLGMRLLGSKGNLKNWRGGVAGLFWNNHTSVTSARIAAYAAAALEPDSGDTTGERVERILDDAGFPSTDRSIATGYTTLGPSRHAGDYQLDTLRRVEKAEQGRFFISRSGDAVLHARYHGQLVASASSATFSDDGADNPYQTVEVNRPRRFIFNKVTCTTDGGQPITVSDADSITSHGERETSVDSPLLSDANVQRSLGEYVLANSKDPQPRVFGLTVPVHKDPVNIGGEVLPLEQGDRVTFQRTPVGTGSAIDWDQIIEGYSERFDSLTWTWTPHLSPAEPVTYWVWGTGAWNTTAIWGY
jgi:hypothetical protein